MKKIITYIIVISILAFEVLYLSLNNQKLRRDKEYFIELLYSASSPNQEYFPNFTINRLGSAVTERLLNYFEKKDIILFMNQKPEEINNLKDQLDNIAPTYRIIALFEDYRSEKYLQEFSLNKINNCIGVYEIFPNETILIPKAGVYFLSSDGRLVNFSKELNHKLLKSLRAYDINIP